MLQWEQGRRGVCEEREETGNSYNQSHKPDCQVLQWAGISSLHCEITLWMTSGGEHHAFPPPLHFNAIDKASCIAEKEE